MKMFKDDEVFSKYIESIKDMPEKNSIGIVSMMNTDYFMPYTVFDMTSFIAIASFYSINEAIRYAYFYENQDQYPSGAVCEHVDSWNDDENGQN
jgi:hypothetical protein